MVPEEETGVSPEERGEELLTFGKIDNNNDRESITNFEGEASVGETTMKYGSCNESGQLLARELLARELQARELLSREMGSQTESQDRRRRSKARRSSSSWQYSNNNNNLDSCNNSLDGSTMSRSRWEPDPSENFQHESASLPAEFLYFKFEQIVARWAMQKTASVMSLERRRPKLMNRPPRTITTIAKAMPEEGGVPRFMRNTTSRSIQLDSSHEGTIDSRSVSRSTGPQSVVSTQLRARKLNKGKPMVIQTTTLDTPVTKSKTASRSKATAQKPATGTREQQQQGRVTKTPLSKPTTKRKASPSPSPARNATNANSNAQRQTPKKAGGAPSPMRSSSPLKSRESPMKSRVTPSSSKTPIASNKQQTKKPSTPSTPARRPSAKSVRQIEARSPLDSTEHTDASHYRQRESPSQGGSIISPRSRAQQASPKPDPEGPSPNSKPDPDGDRWPPTPPKSRLFQQTASRARSASPVVSRPPSPSSRSRGQATPLHTPQNLSGVVISTGSLAADKEPVSPSKASRSKTPQAARQSPQQAPQTPNAAKAIESSANKFGDVTRRTAPRRANSSPRTIIGSNQSPAPNTTRSSSASPARAERSDGPPTDRAAARTKTRPSTLGIDSPAKAESPVKNKASEQRPTGEAKSSSRRRKSRLPPLPSFRSPPTPPQTKQHSKQSTPSPKEDSPTPSPQKRQAPTKKGSPAPSPQSKKQTPTKSKGTPLKARSAASPRKADRITTTPQRASPSPRTQKASSNVQYTPKAQSRDAPWREPENPEGKAAESSSRKLEERTTKRQDPPTPRPLRRVGRMHARAATLLQAFVRMIPVRRQFLLTRASAVKIQLRLRQRIQKGTRLQNFSCVVIQRNYRMFSCRASYIQLRNTVIVLQSAARMFSCRSAYKELRHASQKLLGRGYPRTPTTPSNQVTVKGGRLRIYSALLIQSLVRMRGVRTAYLELRSSALIIQKWFRVVRKVLKAQNDAAIVMQSWSRMLSWRWCFLDLRRSAIKMQSFTRMVYARLRYLAMKQIQAEDTAAALIQSVYRREACRNAFCQLRMSVILLQQWSRETMARIRYKKMCAAALTLQCWWRQKSSERLVLHTICAKLIQGCYRGYIAHRAYMKKRICASMIQSVVRGCIHRVRFLYLKYAATITQKNRRRKLALALISKLRQEAKISAKRLEPCKMKVPDFLLPRSLTREHHVSNETSEPSESTPDPSETSLDPNNSITESIASSSMSSDDESTEYYKSPFKRKRVASPKKTRHKNRTFMHDSALAKTHGDAPKVSPRRVENQHSPKEGGSPNADRYSQGNFNSVVHDSKYELIPGDGPKVDRYDTPRKGAVPNTDIHTEGDNLKPPTPGRFGKISNLRPSPRAFRSRMADIRKNPPSSFTNPNAEGGGSQSSPYNNVVSAALAFVSQSPSQNSRKARELFLSSPKHALESPQSKPAASPQSPPEHPPGLDQKTSRSTALNDRNLFLARRRQMQHHLEASSSEDSIDAPPTPRQMKLSQTRPTRDPVGDNMSRHMSTREPPTPQVTEQRVRAEPVEVLLDASSSGSYLSQIAKPLSPAAPMRKKEEPPATPPVPEDYDIISVDAHLDAPTSSLPQIARHHVRRPSQQDSNILDQNSAHLGPSPAQMPSLRVSQAMYSGATPSHPEQLTWHEPQPQIPGSALPGKLMPAPPELVAKLPSANLSPTKRPIYFISENTNNESNGQPQLYALQPIVEPEDHDVDFRPESQSHQSDSSDSDVGLHVKAGPSPSPAEERKGLKNSILEGLKKERKRKTSLEKKLAKKFPPQTQQNPLPSTKEKLLKLKENRKKPTDVELKESISKSLQAVKDMQGPSSPIFGKDELEFYKLLRMESMDNIPSIAENPSYYLPKTEIKTPRLKDLKPPGLKENKPSSMGTKDDHAPRVHVNPLKQVVHNRNDTDQFRLQSKKTEEYSEMAISEKLATIKQKSRARKVQKWSQRTQKRSAAPIQVRNDYDDEETRMQLDGQNVRNSDGLSKAAVHEWAKQTVQRRKLSIFTSGMEGEFATSIQSIWRSHRDQVLLATHLLQTFTVSCEFSPDTMKNDRILRQTATILALDGAYGQVGYRWQDCETRLTQGHVMIQWEGFVPISFSEHGLPAEDTCCAVSVHCSVKEGLLVDSWSKKKLRILLLKATIEKHCDEQRQRLRRSSMFEKGRQNVQNQTRAQFRVEAQTKATTNLRLRHNSATRIQRAFRRYRKRAKVVDQTVFLGVPNDFQERMRVYSAVLIQSWYRMCVCRSMFQGLRRIQSTVLLRTENNDVETIRFHRCFEPRKFETIIEEGFECTTGSQDSN